MSMRRLFPGLSVAVVLIAASIPLRSQAQESASTHSPVRELPTLPLDHSEHSVVPGSQPGIHVPSSLKPTTVLVGTPVSHPNPYYILPKISVQPIYLGPYFNPQTSNGAAWVNYLNPFMTYIVGSSYMSSLAPYGVSTGTARGGLWSSMTLPHYSSTNQVFLEDSKIRSTLTSWLKAGYLKTNDTLFVFTEPGVAVRFNNNNSQTSMNAFLGYHYWFTWVDSTNTTRYATYAVIPFPGYPNYTPASCGFATYGDMVTNVSSHELGEAATDPYAGTYPGWTETIWRYDYSTAKYTVAYSGVTGEVGDAAEALFPAFATHNCRLNGYSVQKLIAPTGVSLITPAGAKAPSAAEVVTQPVLQAVDRHLSIYGLELPTP